MGVKKRKDVEEKRKRYWGEVCIPKDKKRSGIRPRGKEEWILEESKRGERVPHKKNATLKKGKTQGSTKLENRRKG